MDSEEAEEVAVASVAVVVLIITTPAVASNKIRLKKGRKRQRQDIFKPLGF